MVVYIVLDHVTECQHFFLFNHQIIQSQIQESLTVSAQDSLVLGEEFLMS